MARLTQQEECFRLWTDGGMVQQVADAGSAADKVFRTRAEHPTERVAVFTVVPPSETGVATYTFKLHHAAADKYDLFSTFRTEGEYRDQSEKYGKSYNVLPMSFFPSMAKKVPYKARVYVIGNSPHHSNTLKAAIASVGEDNRYLYLHEAMVHGAFFDILEGLGISKVSFLFRWYPELAAEISSLSHQGFFEFCKEHDVYGIRPLVHMTGIRSIIVNNKACEEMVRSDLHQGDRKRLTVIRRYLPIAPISGAVPFDFGLADGVRTVGTFGAPNAFKGTDRVVDAVALLNDRGVKTKLVMAGFHAKEYVMALPKEKQQFCIVPPDTTDNAAFWNIMKGVEVAVQLRLQSLGESSGCINELLGMNVPVVVNKGFVDEPISQLTLETAEDPQPSDIVRSLEAVFLQGRRAVDFELVKKFCFANAASELYDVLTPNHSAALSRTAFELHPQDRQNLIFDVSQLACVGRGTRDRDGIYFVSINLLKKFAASGRYNISFYCRRCFLSNLDDLRAHDVFWSLFDVLDPDELDALAPDALRGVYFSPMFAVPDFIKRQTSMRKFVLLYDAIPTLFRDRMAAWSEPGFWYNELVGSMSSDEHYFTDSENSRRDFIRITGLPAKCFTTTLIATGNDYRRITDEKVIRDVRRKYNIPEKKKIVFSLCSINFRKNLVHGAVCFLKFLKEHKVDDMVLALGGGGGESFLAEVSSRTNVPPKELAKDICLCGYIDDADVSALYSMAEFFIYPSLYEGFGMPPLEAMQCGCPVITSDNSSLPEVVGRAAIMVDAQDERALVEAMGKVHADGALRERMSRRGLLRAKKFNWDACASKIMTEFERFSFHDWFAGRSPRCQNGKIRSSLLRFDAFSSHELNLAEMSGESLLFSAKNPAAKMMQGFYAREDWGVWTGARDCLFAVRFPVQTEDLLIELKTVSFAKENHVALCANGITVASWDVQPSEGCKTHEILLPAEMTRAAVYFTLKQTSLSAAGDVGTSADARLLGIGLQSMRLRTEDVGVLGLQDEICFNDESAKVLLLSGFGAVEPWGVWCDGVRARLALRLPESSGRLVLSVRARCFDEKCKKIRVSYSGTELAVWEVPTCEPTDYALDCTELPRGKKINLVLEPSAMSRPCDVVSGSQDARELSLGLISARLLAQ